MYFKDLSPYAYGTYYGRDRIIPLTEVLTVGWLENGHDYPKGPVDEQTLLKLRQFLVTSKANLISHRGFHYCDFCDSPEQRRSPPRLIFGTAHITLGYSILWIPSATLPDVIYAAPSLIYHYIVKHKYRPPDEFLKAVSQYEPDGSWNAWEIHNKLLEKHRKHIRDEENPGG